MSDVAVSYGRPFDLIAFFGCIHKFLTIIHVRIVVFPQTFTDCTSNQD